jgi:hypothetical protein
MKVKRRGGLPAAKNGPDFFQNVFDVLHRLGALFDKVVCARAASAFPLARYSRIIFA